MEVTNYLLGYENLNIVQDTEMFHFSLDSVLLPNFVTLNKKISQVLDIGCGNAPIPLILSTLTDAHITGIEVQEKVFELARKSVSINGLDQQISIVCQDVNDYYQEHDGEFFDVITCNPPFFKVLEGSNLNKNEYKTIARHEVLLNLEQLLKISRKLLKNQGVLGIVHRPDRLSDILYEMRVNHIEPKKIQFVHPFPDQEANIVLVEGMKNGKPGMKVLPPIYTHNEDGSYTPQVKKYFENR